MSGMASHKHKQKASNEAPHKVGNQGNFHGPHLAFLESKLPEYYTAVNTKSTPKFWGPIYSLYHQYVDWHIPLNQPYPEDHMFPCEADSVLDHDISEKKKVAVSNLNKVYYNTLV